MREQPLTAAQEWRANWPLVLAAMAGFSFGTIPSTTLGLFMVPLEQEFGWSRAMISAGMLIFALIAMPLTPFAGAMVDKWGARRCAIPGLAASGLLFAAFSLMTGASILWWGVWVLYSVASLFIRSMVWSSAVSNAFSASRGLALALFLSGLAIAQVLGPPLTHALIENLGWRAAYSTLGMGWAGASLVLVFFFFRNRLEQAGEPDTGQQAALARTVPGGLTLGQALRNPAMLRIGLAIFLVSLMSSAVVIHAVPLLEASGLTRTHAAGLASILGIGSVAGKLLTGVLVDRLTTSLLPFAVYTLPALSYFIILQAGPNMALLGVAVFVLGYGSGGSLQMSTYLTSRYAGVRHFGKIFGLISSLMSLAAGIGPLVSGWIYDTTGSYQIALIIAIPAVLAAGIAVLGLGPYPDFGPSQPERVAAKDR